MGVLEISSTAGIEQVQLDLTENSSSLSTSVRDRSTGAALPEHCLDLEWTIKSLVDEKCATLN